MCPFRPFGGWTGTPVLPPEETMKPTLPIGTSSRKPQPVRYDAYRLPPRDWQTILRMYRLYRRAGKERRWTHNEIAVELEYAMWEITKGSRRSKGSAGGGKPA